MKAVSGITYLTLLVMMVTACMHAVIATEIELVEVEGDDFRLLIFDLDEGETFKGSLVMVAGDEIEFKVYDPRARTIVVLGRISQGASFKFTAKETGTYTFSFDNHFSSESKLVELSYDIHPPPSIELDLSTILIIACLLVMAIVIVFWWRFR